MAVPDLPKDLIAFLQADTSPTVAAGSYGVLTLLPPDRLRVELLPVKPTLSPIAGEDPHGADGGHYAVPAVNLIVGDPEAPARFPEWLLLWLPNERRFGAYDLGHRDLMVFGVEVRWSDIAADPLRYLAAAEGDHNATVGIEFFRPWPTYPYTSAAGLVAPADPAVKQQERPECRIDPRGPRWGFRIRLRYRLSLSELLELNRSSKTQRLKGWLVILMKVALIAFGIWIVLFQDAESKDPRVVFLFGVICVLLGLAAPSIAGFGTWALRRSPPFDLIAGTDGIQVATAQGFGLLPWNWFSHSYQTRTLLVLEIGWKDALGIPRRACDPEVWPRLVELAQVAGRAPAPKVLEPQRAGTTPDGLNREGGMRYLRFTDEGYHAPGEEWGEPTYWLEVNERGDAERQLELYPNGRVLAYDRTYAQDEYGALGVMVFSDNEDWDWWASFEVNKEDFEDQWLSHAPLNRRG